MFSQNNEELIISRFFGPFVGSLLSLGENDGVTLSNVRALIEKGWHADLVEPSPVAFAKLQALYPESSDQPVKLHNVAIGNVNGKLPFYDSGTLLGIGDESLVSTLVPTETERWTGKVPFKAIEVDVITVSTLLERTRAKTFDLISIDCEGLDLYILQQLNLVDLQTRMVIVEYNGKQESEYQHYVQKYGFRLVSRNAENLIYVR